MLFYFCLLAIKLEHIFDDVPAPADLEQRNKLQQLLHKYNSEFPNTDANEGFKNFIRTRFNELHTRSADDILKEFRTSDATRLQVIKYNARHLDRNFIYEYNQETGEFKPVPKFEFPASQATKENAYKMDLQAYGLKYQSDLFNLISGNDVDEAQVIKAIQDNAESFKASKTESFNINQLMKPSEYYGSKHTNELQQQIAGLNKQNNHYYQPKFQHGQSQTQSTTPSGRSWNPFRRSGSATSTAEGAAERAQSAVTHGVESHHGSGSGALPFVAAAGILGTLGVLAATLFRNTPRPPQVAGPVGMQQPFPAQPMNPMMQNQMGNPAMGMGMAPGMGAPGMMPGQMRFKKRK
eukprot:NODE_182_length_13754_cov_0.678067.p2 type:complete len:351 gc:universal NODE_182_length_13754_cov_0.678067:11038-9986(-)